MYKMEKTSRLFWEVPLCVATSADGIFAARPTGKH